MCRTTLALLLLLAGCQAPPPEAYAGRSHAEGDGVVIGRNAADEVCRQYVLPNGGGADLYCGTWKQPTARVRSLAEHGTLAEQANRFTAALAPRVADCGTPEPLAFPGADAALQMACIRSASGSPHLALAAQVGDRSWFADGIPVALPVMERSIGVLTGRASPETVQAAAPLPAASRSLGGANDVDLYQALMRDGADANRTGNWEQAATQFRHAVEVQEKVQGRDSPALVNALTGLAVQLSNQGKFAESHATLARAETLASGTNAALLRARLTHYRGLDELNQGHAPQALELLRNAEFLYAATLPADVLKPPPPASLASRFAPTPATSLLTSGAETRPTFDVATLEALLGIIETRRNQAIAQRLSGGDSAAALTAVDSAEAFARAQGLTGAMVSAFVYRTAGVTVLEGGQPGDAVARFDASVSAFTRGMPRTLPLAETLFRRAEALLKGDKPADALAACQLASGILRDLKQGVDGARLQPCMTAYATQARHAADPQPLLAEMFELAQLTRGAITAEQIQRAAVRLAAAPEIGSWVRAHDDADTRLNDLLRRKIELSDPAANPSPERIAELDAGIAKARTALDQAEVELQDKLPNYNALVQQVVPAATLFAVLRPGEAFAAITLAQTEGWTFLLRDNTIRIGHIEGGAPRIAGLVRRVRAGIEPTSNNELPNFDAEAARELYTAALGEVAPGLEGAAVFSVAPTGALLSLPFEVLLTGPATGATLADAPFLVKRFPIVHGPSAANLVSLRRAATAAHAAKPWFGFGGFQPIDRVQAARLYPGVTCAESASQLTTLPALPGAQAELEAVRRQLGALPTEQLLGAGFTRSAVLKHNLQDYRILHFATHALLPSEIACQQEPAIVTSVPPGEQNAGLLTATDVLLGLRLDADVVVLSACNSGGSSGRDGGESLSGLARTFFFAGARALMVTHWDVEDQAGAYLVSNTLAGMRAGADGGLAASLRKVQLQMLATKGYEHPFFWAPVVVIGEGGGPAAVVTVSPPHSVGL